MAIVKNTNFDKIAKREYGIPYPLTMLTVPGGKPASVMNSASFNAVRGAAKRYVFVERLVSETNVSS